MRVRVCRDCGAEYRPDIERCADCGSTSLDERYDEEGGAYRPPTVPEPPPPPVPADHRMLHTSYQAGDVLTLARRLTEAGIPFHLGQRRGEDEEHVRFVLSVSESEHGRAIQALGPLLGDRQPTSEGAGHFDPEKGYTRCPACGADVRSGLAECPECGLVLAGEAEPPVCAVCGTAGAPGATRCPACDQPYELDGE